MKLFLKLKNAMVIIIRKKKYQNLDGYAFIMENVLKFGIFNHPIEVGKFLWFQDENLTRERYQENMRKNGLGW